jgi:SAM-dependent methyltransferase
MANRPARRPEVQAGSARDDWFRFTRVDAADYERFRPDYAPATADWLAERAYMEPASVVVDMGAGTGKLTRLFVGRAAMVLGLEPAANMLAILRRVVPQARAVAGTAEAIPLPDASVDMVAAGHAFHHFDWEPALREIDRVLRPGGSLALVWAMADTDDQVSPLVGAIVDRYLPTCPIRAAFDAWREAFAGNGGARFEEVDAGSFPHQQQMTREGLVTVMATSSDVASLPPSEQRALLREVQDVVRQLPEPIVIPRRTQIHVFRRPDDRSIG